MSATSVYWDGDRTCTIYIMALYFADSPLANEKHRDSP